MPSLSYIQLSRAPPTSRLYADYVLMDSSSELYRITERQMFQRMRRRAIQYFYSLIIRVCFVVRLKLLQRLRGSHKVHPQKNGRVIDYYCLYFIIFIHVIKEIFKKVIGEVKFSS